MEDKDPFKEEIRKKIFDLPVSSEKDVEIWEKVLSQTNRTKEASRSIARYWYAAAASVVLCIGIALGTFTFNNNNTKENISYLKKSSDPHTKATNKSHAEDLISKYRKSPEIEQTMALAKKRIVEEEKEIESITAEKGIVLHELQDKSLVTLNRGSQVKFSKSFKVKREIWLEGESFFDVTPDKLHPFTVNFSSNHLIVLGTKFNVKSIPNDTTQVITVLEGQVKVYNSFNKKGVTVNTGEQLLLSNEGKNILKKVNSEKYISWKLQLMNFHNKTLEEVCYTLSKLYEVEINMVSHIKKCKFTGDLTDLSLEESIKILCATSSLQVKNENDNYYLTGVSCD